MPEITGKNPKSEAVKTLSETLEKAAAKKTAVTKKELSNTTVEEAKANTSDLVVFGDGNLFQLLCKASSESAGWMKSTKAMEIYRAGCVVQVTTQQGDNVSESVVFVPGVKIQEIKVGGEVTGRKLVHV